ncbi:LysM peptidoglycan-binding domain-containing protein [Mariprofundus sp. KV]|nr:lytic transglycosylase domain-containing protein [Mariprofundus sp. KV]NWF35593.1 LysM peptidoglycan-binding domain-containing protein [Mariprofundus sp. KV]
MHSRCKQRVLFHCLVITAGALLFSAPSSAEEQLQSADPDPRLVNYHGSRLQHAANTASHQLKLSHTLVEPQHRKAEPLLAGINESDIITVKEIARKRFSKRWDLVSERSRFVRHRLVGNLEKISAPLSLQVIPVVESTYSPYALSHAGAAGLWQLMPGTAKVLGIQPDKKIDGRRDIERSTQAAATYLMQQHDRFDNWPLAIAAYNLGPYAVSKRLKNSPWDMADGLDAMPVPLETRNYVKHIIGLVALLDEGTLQFPSPIKTRTVQLNPPVDIQLLAQLSGMEKDEIFLFNPSLNQAQYLTRPVTIHVPEAAHPRVEENIIHSGPKFVSVTVREGNSMWSIARANGTDVKTVKQLNPGISNVLRIGQKLKVPANQLAKASANINPLLPSKNRVRYKVRSGDSLWRIANRFGTTVKALSRVNSLSKKSVIRAGDILWVLARVRPS